jgi:perosamine synthetase
VKTFEDDFSDNVQVRQTVAVSNGTGPLHLALLAPGIDPGDDVIVPILTYITAVNSFGYTGTKPVSVDSLKVFGGEPGGIK